jgi:hypothetical protein
VRVIGQAVAGNGVPGNADESDQDFALVVSNADEQAAPVLVHEASTVDDSGGDSDGTLESGEPFELDEQLRNAGDAGADGVSGTLLSGGGMAITQSSGSWAPSLGPGPRAQTPRASRVSSPQG